MIPIGIFVLFFSIQMVKPSLQLLQMRRVSPLIRQHRVDCKNCYLSLCFFSFQLFMVYYVASSYYRYAFTFDDIALPTRGMDTQGWESSDSEEERLQRHGRESVDIIVVFHFYYPQNISPPLSSSIYCESMT